MREETGVARANPCTVDTGKRCKLHTEMHLINCVAVLKVFSYVQHASYHEDQTTHPIHKLYYSIVSININKTLL